MSFMCLPLEQCWPHRMPCKGKWNSLKKLGEKLKGMGGVWCNRHINKIHTIVKFFFFFNFFKLGQHGSYQLKLFPSEFIDGSNHTAVVLKAGLIGGINRSYIFALCIIILL